MSKSSFRPINYPKRPEPNQIVRFLVSAANGSIESEELKDAANTTLKFLSDYDFPDSVLTDLLKSLKEGDAEHNREVIITILTEMSIEEESIELNEDYLQPQIENAVNKNYHTLTREQQYELFKKSPKAFNQTKRQIEGKRIVSTRRTKKSTGTPLPEFD